MKAMFLIAGRGRRLRPYTDTQPKCMVPLHGEPLLSTALHMVARVGIDRAVLVVGHMEDVIRAHYGERFAGVELTYVSNPDYATTNNLYTMWLAREQLDEDLILLEGDLRYDVEILQRLVDHPAENVAVVDVGQNVMQITVLRNDQSVYAREQAFGGSQLTQDIVARYGMSPEEAENAKRTGGLPDDYEAEVLRPFMENVAMEVQRALQFFFSSTQFNTVDHILLAGGSAVIPGLDEVVNTRTQVPAIVANPFASMQTSPRIQLKRLIVDAPSLIVACGLAMRRFDPI